MERALFEVKHVVVGQDAMVERMLVGLLARGHVLIEGVPGVAKTLPSAPWPTVVGGTFHRLQFTPDLMPGDIVGTRVWRPRRRLSTPNSARSSATWSGRRDQPRPGQGAVRAAGGDGRTAGQHRRSQLSRCRTVPGAGHPEPHRDRRRVPWRSAADRFLLKVDVAPDRGGGARHPGSG